jgi:predicted amidohydrolase
MDCAGRPEEIERRALLMIRRAAGLRADVACLPEHWVPGGIRDRARFLDAFGKAARELGIFVVPGAEFVRGDGSTVVESFLLGPDGFVGSQKKVHLFGRERRKARPGNGYSVFGLKGAKVGIAICHDLVYPEVARIFALKGADVILSPAKIGRLGLRPWHLYVDVRSLENRIPIVSPNVLELPRFPGGSVIVGIQDAGEGVVYPRTLARAGAAPRLLIADLDLSEARKARRARLRARRVETFSPILQR